MKTITKQKILFIIILFLILILLYTTSIQQPIAQGKISEIKYHNHLIKISLYNNTNQFLIFTNKLVNIGKNQKIKIYGKQEYKNKKEIIVNKIIASP